jgi:hypothetical protein
VALVGVILPVIQHFSTTLPARQLVHDARQVIDNIDERFAAWASGQEQKLIDGFIAQLTSDQPHEQQMGYVSLSLRQYVRFSEVQIVAMGEAARESKDFGMRSTIFNLVATYDMPYVERLLLDVLRDSQAFMYLGVAVRHCELPGATRLRLAVRQWAKANPTALPSLMVTGLSTGRRFILELINDESWLAGFEDRPLQAAIVTLAGSADTYGVGDAVRASMLFARKKA